MKHYHDIKLPNFISIYAKGGPRFSTICSTSSSGRELRISERNKSINYYDISNCFLSAQQFSELNAFFRARQGRQFAFRMKDHADYDVRNQLLAISDGSNINLPIYKLYQDQYNSYQRRINKPILSSTSIQINGCAVSNDQYLIDENGVVNFVTALPIGDEVRITTEYDVLVRFDSDNFDYSFVDDGSIKIEGLKLVEVLL